MFQLLQGRYSFVGATPELEIVARGQQVCRLLHCGMVLLHAELAAVVAGRPPAWIQQWRYLLNVAADPWMRMHMPVLDHHKGSPPSLRVMHGLRKNG